MVSAKPNRFPLSTDRTSRTGFKSALFVSLLLCCVHTCLAQEKNSVAEESPAGSTTIVPKQPDRTVRIATFNTSMNRGRPGALLADLMAHDRQIEDVAAILRTVRPQIVLLNEFDFSEGNVAVDLFRSSFLEAPLNGYPNAEPIHFPFCYVPSVNTGVPSGMDLDQNGSSDDPADAFGFGAFPGQYGMVVLSRYPVATESIRTFQTFLWNSLPDAAVPRNPDDNQPWYSESAWTKLRLSSKNHCDVPITIDGSRTVHLLISHPTPPAFDGPEDRNGRRNHDEIRFWAEYLSGPDKAWIIDDRQRSGGLSKDQPFVILGDLNADPHDGDSFQNAIHQLLNHPRIHSPMIPESQGGQQAAVEQGGVNEDHKGPPQHDTSDFFDRTVGNLRIDYILPSTNLTPVQCGVFWPENGEPFSEAIRCSDHRLVWMDLKLHTAAPGN